MSGLKPRGGSSSSLQVIASSNSTTKPGVPPASPIEDRGTAIPTEDRDRAIPERLSLYGVIVKELSVSLMWRKNDSVGMTGSCMCQIGNPGLLSETSSLTPHILLQVTSRKDRSTRGIVGAGVDWTSFGKDSFSRYMKSNLTQLYDSVRVAKEGRSGMFLFD
ncbi:hypothetical protein F2Q70_00039729 [Brassica cretica]|uniref:Uncharacterized protein n=1 Tax=Brassica cretica TaxID=69181 RepID=A0A8S9K944_BRACR|nr:hypothetical protein F2Q70_00039729 [Brassica cretica]